MLVRRARYWRILLVGLVLTAASAMAAPSASAKVPDTPPAAGQFHGLRYFFPNPLTIAKGATATLQVSGVGGIPATGVDSVWLNLDARGTDGHGGLVVYPSGAGEPAVTGSQYQPEGYNGDLLLVKLGADGKVKLGNTRSVTATSVTVYLSVHGYTLTSAGSESGSTYVGVSPFRAVNAASIPAGGTYTFAATGIGSVPTAGVSHLLFTLVGSATQPAHLRAYPNGTSRPVDTNLTVRSGNYLDNLVVAGVGSDGKVAVSNDGAAAATIWVYVSGYYAKRDAAVTASLTHVLQPTRIASNVSIASGAEYTVAPLGTAGVPASGVTAAGFNITVLSSDNGAVLGRPAGESGAGSWVVGYPSPKVPNAGFVASKLGAAGKVILRNNGDSAVSVSVDVFAYFSPTPSGCSGTAPARAARTSPGRAARTAVAEPDPYTPTTVFQSSPASAGSSGVIEFAYTDGIGRLMHGRADPSVLGSVQWTPIHGQEGYYGRPTLGEQADGRLNVLAHDLSGDVWSRTQATKDPAAWGDWVDVHQPMGSTVTVARQDDTLVAFAVDTAGALWALPQYAANGAYREWIDLGVTGVSASTAPIAVPVADGLRLFFLDASGTWRTALYARGLVSGCASLSVPGFSGNASVVTYPGSRLRIFVRSPDGHIVTKMQDGAGAFPQNWDQVGDLVAAGSPSALLSPRSGKTEVVVRGTDARIHSTGETLQGTGEWRGWANAQPDTDTSVPATDPTAFEYSGPSGFTWSYIFRNANQETRLYWPEGETPSLAASSPAFKGRALPRPPSAR